MRYAYYPGCSLTGSARKLDKAVRYIFQAAGHELQEIPDWNCCGAFEYGDRRELMGFSEANLRKAQGSTGGPVLAPKKGADRVTDVVAPCPACYRNLKEANTASALRLYHPLELLNDEFLASIPMQRDLKGQVYTPYYGCVLMRPPDTAIVDKEAMERIITRLGGEIEGRKIRDRCCGGNQFFINRWATERLSRIILEQSKGAIVVFCPLCHMALTSFSKDRKILYLTDLLLYAMGQRRTP
jgi:heterodisulfide reductase subunit B